MKLNLELAWKRIREDIKNDRVFIENPYEILLIEKDLDGWLNKLDEKLELGEYSPSHPVICDCPKDNYGIRPGSHLNLTDRVVYTALLGECLPFIYKELEWSQNKVDFCHILNKDITSQDWIKNPFISWENFRLQSIKTLEENSYIVLTDVAAFYENINIETLISDLRDMNIDTAVTELLKKCLRKWGQNMKGLPQGYIASDILSKVYLNNIDVIMKNKGYVVLRYSDDIRIFCKDQIEAKKSIMELIKLLRNRGLNIQSAKTKICKSEEGKQEIDEISTIIENIKKKFKKELAESGLGNPYMSDFNMSEVLSNSNDIELPLQELQKTYKTYFISSNEKFRKTLFRFLLRLLGEGGDNYAIESCSQFIIDHPEETKSILKYFALTLNEKEINDILGKFLKSNNAIYHFQNYLILQFFVTQKLKPGINIMQKAREFTFDRNIPFYLRSVSRKIISNFGTSADLERILSTYSETENELEKAEIICSLKRMEVTRRNSFFSQVKDDGDLQRRAVRYTKEN